MQISDMRCRSVFYTALGRLLLINLGEDEDKFDQFMMPLTSKFYFMYIYIYIYLYSLQNHAEILSSIIYLSIGVFLFNPADCSVRPPVVLLLSFEDCELFF